MGVFLLPLELCQQMERLICKFWWNNDAKKDRSIHWQSWNSMCKRKSEGGMGFRNLRDFNIALLGNQGWRLLKFPDKLVSRVYKARYYSGSSFLTATIGNNPSYIWRSILECQNLIRKGVGCRIGNGESVNILNEPWLPDANEAYIQSSNVALIDQKVSTLMSMESNNWDSDLIFDLFCRREATIILSTPLDKEVEDSWYWRKEKMGCYSVKSAYMLLQHNGDNNSLADNSGFWKKLWNLKIPPKIKNFLWRACTSCLPTKDMLISKRVQVNPMCSLCNIQPESILHVFVDCTYTVSCWEKFQNLHVQGQFHTFPEWLNLVFQQHSNDEICNIVTIIWMLWKSRNDLVWNQKSLEPSEVVQSAFSVLNQWRSVQDRTFDRFLGYLSEEDGAEHWCPPTLNSIKVNSDAAIFEESGHYSYAFAARDHEGRLIEARVRRVRGSPDADLAEAIGVREALSWIKGKELVNVVLESDCLQVVQAIRSSFLCYSYLGRVINECRVLLASLVRNNVKFIFVKRSANKVADFIAKHLCSTADRTWRMGDVHSDINNVMLNDLK